MLCPHPDHPREQRNRCHLVTIARALRGHQWLLPRRDHRKLTGDRSPSALLGLQCLRKGWSSNTDVDPHMSESGRSKADHPPSDDVVPCRDPEDPEGVLSELRVSYPREVPHTPCQEPLFPPRARRSPRRDLLHRRRDGNPTQERPGRARRGARQHPGLSWSGRGS